MCCCDVVFPRPPCSMMHIHCLFRCILLQTGNNVCVRLETGTKKKRSDSKPLFHAPLVHQGNNRLIQRLRSGPLESGSCSHGGFGMAGVRQSLSGCVVLGTLHTLWQAQTNSGTQSRPWHQTPLCQNRAVFRRRRAQNPNNQHAFFFFPTLWSAVEKTNEPISEASRRRVLLQFVMLDGNPSKQTRWELSLKWGEAT